MNTKASATQDGQAQQFGVELYEVTSPILVDAATKRLEIGSQVWLTRAQAAAMPDAVRRVDFGDPTEKAAQMVAERVARKRAQQA